ncbi:zinc finger protein 638-like isoform X2 [Poeciliopsis prolifica]|uniref:zinc finger protein 638-like isoform X2 n=1 Tax=Poeciliopsis prolifica TaxID=188132 RepID=UPI002413EC79|nr:zinc finger protein 638-like isoform X2 [Poeciliopsis prolifica]
MSQSTQNQNGPSAKKLPKGFSNPGPASRLTCSGSGSSSLANYLAAQTTSVSDNDKLVDRVKHAEHHGMNRKTCFSERNDFTSTSARPSTSHVGADLGDFSLDWLPIFKSNTNNNPPAFSSGSDGRMEVVSGEQKDDRPSIPGSGENPVPGRFILSSEFSQLKHTGEPVAAILQSFGLEDGLKKIDPHILKQVNPAKLSCVLHQIFSKMETNGKSSEHQPKLKSILKPSKVRDSSYADVEKNNNSRIVDELPPDKRSTTALGSEKTSVAPTDSDPPERVKEKDAISATHNVISNSNAENKQKTTEKQKPEQQKNVKHKSELKLDEHLQNKPAKKSEKGSVKTPLGKNRKDQMSNLSKLPSIVREWVLEQMKLLEDKQPTLAMIEDYNGVTPRFFPHQCSLCDVICQKLGRWFLHLNETNHIGNRILLQLKYPEWVAKIQPLPRKKEKKSLVDSKSLKQQKVKADGHKESNNLRHHQSQRSRSRSRSPRGKCRRSSTVSSSGDKGEQQSRTDPFVGGKADPEPETPARYTPESGAEVLNMFGLDKEDLKELESYPEDQLTCENLHLVLREIFLRKKRRALEPKNDEPGGRDQTLPGPLKPVKVIDYGHCANYSTLRDTMETTTEDDPNPTGRKESPLETCDKPTEKDTQSITATQSTLKVMSKSKKPSSSKVKGQEKRVKISKKAKLKHSIKATCETRKALPCAVSYTKVSPIKLPPVKSFISNHLPTLAMIKDYISAMQTRFPHTCSICNKRCFHMEDWLSHQNSSFHLESCSILRTQYPHWDGDVLPILSNLHQYHSSEGQKSSSRSWSRSRSRSWSRSRSRSRSRTRSPYDRRYSRRSPSHSWSPRLKKPSSLPCRSHSGSHERRSSSGRKDGKRSSSPRRSNEKQNPDHKS